MNSLRLITQCNSTKLRRKRKRKDEKQLTWLILKQILAKPASRYIAGIIDVFLQMKENCYRYGQSNYEVSPHFMMPLHNENIYVPNPIARVHERGYKYHDTNISETAAKKKTPRKTRVPRNERVTTTYLTNITPQNLKRITFESSKRCTGFISIATRCVGSNALLSTNKVLGCGRRPSTSKVNHQHHTETAWPLATLELQTSFRKLKVNLTIRLRISEVSNAYSETVSPSTPSCGYRDTGASVAETAMLGVSSRFYRAIPSARLRLDGAIDDLWNTFLQRSTSKRASDLGKTAWVGLPLNQLKQPLYQPLNQLKNLFMFATAQRRFLWLHDQVGGVVIDSLLWPVITNFVIGV